MAQIRLTGTVPDAPGAPGRPRALVPGHLCLPRARTGGPGHTVIEPDDAVFALAGRFAGPAAFDAHLPRAQQGGRPQPTAGGSRALEVTGP